MDRLSELRRHQNMLINVSVFLPRRKTDLHIDEEEESYGFGCFIHLQLHFTPSLDMWGV